MKISSIEEGIEAISEMRSEIEAFKNKDFTKETSLSKTLAFGYIITSYSTMALSFGIAIDKTFLSNLTAQSEAYIVVNILTELTDDIEKKVNRLINLRDDLFTQLKFNDGKPLTRHDVYKLIVRAYINKEERRAKYLGIDFNHKQANVQSNIKAVKTTNYFYYNLKDLAEIMLFKDF